MRAGTTPTAAPRPRSRIARLALIAALGAAVTGCGIRATEVPTDFGAAPSRVPCESTSAGVAPQAQVGVPEQVFLVCGSQLVRVDRAVRLPGGTGPDDRVRVAQALLDELREPPTAAEAQSGFTSDVKGRPKVTGPRPGDPASALRLSNPPERMSPYELAQIVCTFAHGVPTSRGGAVVLGGSDAESPLRRYECTERLRARPGDPPAPAHTVGR